MCLARDAASLLQQGAANAAALPGVLTRLQRVQTRQVNEAHRALVQAVLEPLVKQITTPAPEIADVRRGQRLRRYGDLKDAFLANHPEAQPDQIEAYCRGLAEDLTA